MQVGRRISGLGGVYGIWRRMANHHLKGGEYGKELHRGSFAGGKKPYASCGKDIDGVWQGDDWLRGRLVFWLKDYLVCWEAEPNLNVSTVDSRSRKVGPSPTRLASPEWLPRSGFRGEEGRLSRRAALGEGSTVPSRFAGVLRDF